MNALSQKITNAETDFTGIFISGVISPTGGSGINTSYNTGTSTGTIRCVNYDTSAVKALVIDALSVTVESYGDNCAQFDHSVVANDTRFLVYDVTAGTLQRVTIGANDSGGAGYRVLRIPNA